VIPAITAEIRDRNQNRRASSQFAFIGRENLPGKPIQKNAGAYSVQSFLAN
jgi:hypothetical protein